MDFQFIAWIAMVVTVVFLSARLNSKRRARPGCAYQRVFNVTAAGLLFFNAGLVGVGSELGSTSTATSGAAAHFAALIDSTWIVLVLASSVPVTLTFCAANCSGVRWSLSA